LTEPNLAMDEETTRYATNDGVDLAYRVYGSRPGRDVLLVPGLMGHLEFNHEIPFYRSMIDRFPRMGRLVVFDTRGTGLSGGSPSGDAEQQMDDIRSVMDAAGIERATLIGIAESGTQAILFAASHPERVTRLCLFGTTARVAEASGYPGRSEKELDQMVSFTQDHWSSGRVFAFFTSDYEDSVDALERFGRWERNIATPSEAAASTGRFAKTDVRFALSSITAPTLVLHQASDPFFLEEQARFMVGEIENAQLRVMEGFGSHVSMKREWGEQVMDELEQFVTGKPASTRQHDRILATVLFVDLVSSPESASRAGDDSWVELLREFHQSAEDVVRRERGTLVKSTGDGLLATFDSPGRGIVAARAILADASDIGMPARAGLHTGEIELLHEDIGGIAVHIASRIEAAASPGEVLVSQTVVDLMVGSDLRFDSRGQHRLKGLDRDWELHTVRAN
jgi:class 3 adenylate cyclase